MPTRDQIETAFTTKLGRVGKIYQPITSQLAEEAERILMQAWYELKKNQPRTGSITTIQTEKNADYSVKRRYSCSCGSQVSIHHKFCSKCGSALDFDYSRMRHYKKANQQL